MKRFFCLVILTATSVYAADYAPVTNEFVVGPTGSNQIWPSLAIDEARNRIWLTYSQANETYAVAYDLNFNMVVPPKQVNTTTNLQQDEPAISVDKVNGRVLVGWSDRSAQWTQYMDVRGRILDTVTGAFVTGEIALRDPNGNTESKWRPMIDAFPTGGWIVAFTSNWSEAAYIDHIGPNGEYFTGDILLTHLNGHQNYPEVNVFPDGTIYTATLDGYKNYRYRIFNSQFQPFAANYPPASPTVLGQREMRIKNWNNKLFAAWTEMNGADGDVRFQIFDAQFQPLMAPITLNQTLPGLQKDVDLDVALDGTVIAAWEDDNGGQRNYRYRILDSVGVPITPERTINQHPALDLVDSVVAPASVVMIHTGRKAAICWQGKSLIANGQEDAFCRVLQDTTFGANQPPMVSAGPDKSTILANPADLNGMVSDDGLPNPPGQTTIQWSKVSGPGAVTFGNAISANTTATFSQVGTYVLRLTGNDSILYNTDDVQVVVNSTPNTNSPPSVDAGFDQIIDLPASAQLSGNIMDDGLPTPPGQVTIQWGVISGPGSVNFSAADSAATNATFSSQGVYVLSLAANDGALYASDAIQITVNGPANQGGVNALETKFTPCMDLKNPNHLILPPICYQLSNDVFVQISIYSKEGQLVRTLVNGTRPAGINTEFWDRKNDKGEFVSSGIYSLLLKVGDEIRKTKLAVIK